MDFSKYLNYINQCNYYSNYSHITITAIKDGNVVDGVLDIYPENLNHLGIVHGGALVTLADTVAGVAVHSTGKLGVLQDRDAVTCYPLPGPAGQDTGGVLDVLGVKGRHKGVQELAYHPVVQNHRAGAGGH